MAAANLDAPIDFAACHAGDIDVPLILKRAADDDAKINIHADAIENSGENFMLTGNAAIMRGKRGVFAAQIDYQRARKRARANNARLFTAGGDAIYAESVDVEIDDFNGKARGIEIQIADERENANINVGANADVDANPAIRLRGTAREIEFRGEDAQVLTHVMLTACAPSEVKGNDKGNTKKTEAVQLRARQIELDHAAGIGYAKSMHLRFKNIPIFYFPFAAFPITDARKTGFLFPSIGYDGDAGAIVEVPFYLNLAPQYDATLTPRLTAKRGAQLVAQFRHLDRNGRGELRGEFLPNDAQFDDQDRYAIDYRHRRHFAQNWRAALDWQAVSDNAYRRDFSDAVDSIAAHYLSKTAQLSYFGKAVRFEARAADYAPDDDDIARIDRPYQLRPQLHLNLSPPPLGWLAGGLDVEYADFRHAADSPDKPNATRLRLRPHLSLPFKKPHGWLIPQIALQSIRYSFENDVDVNVDVDVDADMTAEMNDAMPNATSLEVPIFTLDARLFFEREYNHRGAAYRQTLEPRLFYVNIPLDDAQNAFMNFDTDHAEIGSLAHLFRPNRFFGGDRIGDTEQIAFGATSQIRDGDGRQRLKLGIGRIVYLQDRVIGLTADAPRQTAAHSGWVGEFDAALSAHWSVGGFAHWRDGHDANDANDMNERHDSLGTVRLFADYYRDPRRQFRIAYIFNDAHAPDIEPAEPAKSAESMKQLNLSFQSPLGTAWQLQGDVAYQLARDEVQSSAVGISYDGCCWAMRAGAQRYLDGEGVRKNRFVFTFQLDNLGGIRSRL